ncbi:MAG: A24 family peptidase, partial [Elusimicrobiales bacterium]|nr:A24 family peptidase [Elusimicrobiales bacterium]
MSALIVITFIDIDFQIIPDRISLSGIVLGYLVSVFIFKRGFINPLLAIFIGGGIFYIVGKGYEIFTKREGLGGGDVKLMAMFGAFLGLKSIPFIILISSLTGTIVGLYLILFKNKDTKFAIPFGPFL